MTNAKDWITLVSEDLGENCILTEDGLREVILKHCPFKPGVTYVQYHERCEHPAHYYPQTSIYDGDPCFCGLASIPQGEGLRRPESPLLECIDCHNTESPAGAMARQFNHGRCLYCGGYFKVVRA